MRLVSRILRCAAPRRAVASRPLACAVPHAVHHGVPRVPDRATRRTRGPSSGAAARFATGLLAVAATLAPRPAAAFGYEEHCRIANRGLRMAMRLIDQQNAWAAIRTPRPADPRGFLATRAVSTCKDNERLRQSYGDLVTMVDAANAPQDYIVGYWNPEAFEMMKSGEIPDAVIARLTKHQLNWLRAMHQNEEHFADRALVAYTLLHRSAVGYAAEGNLGLALLVNAFADHYLSDVHAPGHVRTPRRRLHDEIAAAMHNAYNDRGAIFKPNPNHDWHRYNNDPDLAAFRTSVCDPADMMACMRRLNRDGVRFFGDNKLDASPAQEVVLSLLMAESMREVLEAAVSGSPVGKAPLSDFSYTPAQLGPRKGRWYQPAHYFAPWAHANLKSPVGTFAPDSGRAFVKIAHLLSVNMALQAFTIEPPRVPPAQRRPGLSSRDSARASWADERLRLGADFLAIVWPGDWRLNEKGTGRSGLGQQIVIALGADMVTDIPRKDELMPDVQGVGPYGRLTVPLPQLNMRFSGIVGPRYFPAADKGIAGGNGKWGTHSGVRIDWGYGIGWLGIGFEREKFVDKDTRTLATARWVLSPTLSITLPVGVPLPF